MAFKRRASKIIVKALQRAAGIKAIDPNLALGGPLTLPAYEAEIAAAETILDEYNTLLALLDNKANELKAAEKKVNEWSSRMLAGVAGKFGKDSSEYEMAGGTRTSTVRRKSCATFHSKLPCKERESGSRKNRVICA
ncbi:MAG: hypothetical protein WGN25_12410 [Candidatus Electrothrix sp. GW3-4]|uniref:hypothetical protein n=1 Tax=Candidatus Electrothrix sp. GW3-4 TaxID=3126740 RepID=UPI0030D415BF